MKINMLGGSGMPNVLKVFYLISGFIKSWIKIGVAAPTSSLCRQVHSD
jgi:hypothetical protein